MAAVMIGAFGACMRAANQLQSSLTLRTKKGETIRSEEKLHKAILAVLRAAVLIIAFHHSVFAQLPISGSVADLTGNRNIDGRILPVRDAKMSTRPQAKAACATVDNTLSTKVGGSEAFPQTRLAYSVSLSRTVGVNTDIIPIPHINFPKEGRTSWRDHLALETRPLSWQTQTGKNYLIPALEIPTFLLLLNLYDRLAYSNEMEDGKKTYDSSPSTFWDHLIHGSWGVDHDDFSTNQFAHPYQGSMHHGFARSAGLNYWESLLYANMGSFLWEMGGETTNPSINDQIATGTGGSFLGEALFRMAALFLEGHGEKPGIWRELGAAVLSPPTGINRHVFGNRFKDIFPSHHPATFWSARLGASLNADHDEQSASTNINRYEALADFSMAYGLPGKPGYRYRRPFDYFTFEFAGRGNSDETIDSVMISGLLFGTDYAVGHSYRGIWGLYGGYDYISPHIFPISSTSVSLGTTFQWWLSRTIALQGSVLGGVGYAATGNVTEVHQRDYHYGVTPQGRLALRLIFDDRAMLDFTGRTYHLTGTGGDDHERTEAVDRLSMGLTVRIYDRHALGIQYIASIRDQRYPDQSDAHLSAGVVSLVYTWLGDEQFGAVEWRDMADR